MKLLNKILIFFIFFNYSFANSKPVPDSFADLEDQLMPSVEIHNFLPSTELCKHMRKL